MTKEIITINGVNYAYYWLQKSNPQNPVLICLHGFTGTSQSFSFSFTDINVLAIDLIGHGQTDVYVHPYRYKLSVLVKDLSLLTIQLNIDSFYLLGYSMGARTALTWSIEQPKGIKGLVMEGGTPGIQSPLEKIERQKQDNRLATMLFTSSLAHFIEYWESLPIFNSQKMLPLSVRRNIRQERLSQQVMGLTLSLMYMGTGQQKNYWPDLKQLQLPILYLVGEEDVKFQKIGKQFIEQNKCFRMIQVANSGHCIHLEQPKDFERLVGQWIKEEETKHAINKNKSTPI